jgi:hypothetical protein
MDNPISNNPLSLAHDRLGSTTEGTSRTDVIFDDMLGIKLATERCCKECQKTKFTKDFNKDKNGADGLFGICKECRGKKAASYYQDNKDRIRLRMAEYYEKNKDKWVEYKNLNRATKMWYTANKTAEKKNLPFNITIEDISIPESCPVCGIVMETDTIRNKVPSLDKYEPSRGYVVGNIWVICFKCNTRKQDMTGEKMIDFGTRLVEAFKNAE